MKLSIIVPVYKSEKDLEKYIEKISLLKGKKHEIIFVVHTNLDKSLKVIDEMKHLIKVPVKIVFNSKRTGRIVAVMQGLEVSTGDYIMVHTLKYHYSEDMVKVLIKEAEEKKSDIIEFKPWFSSPIRWKPSIRKTFSKPVNINEHPEIFAYTYFFTFNKIFKRRLFEGIKLIPTLSSTSNLHSMEFLCKLMIVADTYSTSSVSPVKSRKYIHKLYNPLIILKEFKLIATSDIYKKYRSELEYNKYFTESIVFLSLVAGSGNKIVLQKYIQKLEKEYKENDFFVLNQYYLLSNSEGNKIKKYRHEFSPKAYKEF